MRSSLPHYLAFLFILAPNAAASSAVAANRCRSPYTKLYPQNRREVFEDNLLGRQAAPIVDPKKLGTSQFESDRLVIAMEPKLRNNKIHFWLIKNKSNQLIGEIDIQPSGPDPSIGYISVAINSYYQDRGYATEAYRVVLPLAADRLSLREVRAVITDENAASIGVHEKLGFSFDPNAGDWVWKPGKKP